MKKIMKQQSKRFPLWGFKGILSVALSSLGIIAFAQGADVCQGSGYTIADAIPASAGSEYRWLENGLVLSGATAAGYAVPSNKAAGVYTYVRQSKSAECPDWQSSNEFTVTVFACSFTAGTATSATATFVDPRDGKQYKTVVMPDGRTWFAQNLNYTRDLTFNKYSYEANGKLFVSEAAGGAPAIGSYWCPGVSGSTYSGDQNTCNVYGALYTWETAMMVDGKYTDETKTGSAWAVSWISGNYFNTGVPATSANADKNNARGGISAKGGGRGICPMGWHIPTIREWANLLDKVEGDGTGSLFSEGDRAVSLGTDVGIKLKAPADFPPHDGTVVDGSWVTSQSDGSDEYGFSVLGSGQRDYRGNTFIQLGERVSMWSSSCLGSNVAASVCFTFHDPGVQMSHSIATSRGYPIRCLKDE